MTVENCGTWSWTSSCFATTRTFIPVHRLRIVVSDQADPSRVAVNGVLRLTPELEPGNYYLQIVITDKDAPAKKVAPVIQWVDFEIVK